MNDGTAPPDAEGDMDSDSDCNWDDAPVMVVAAAIVVAIAAAADDDDDDNNNNTAAAGPMDRAAAAAAVVVAVAASVWLVLVLVCYSGGEGRCVLVLRL